MDLDPAPVRESTRLSVHHRKNSLCTRGVVVYLRDVASVDNIVGEIILHPKVCMLDVLWWCSARLRDDGLVGAVVVVLT